jgi:hypothetical protein
MRGQVKFVQKKIIAKKRRRIFLLSLYSFVAFGFLVAVLSSISHLDSMTIEKIEVSGNSRLSSVDIENIVREKIAGNFLGFFSRSNVFLYPKEEVIDAIKAIPAVKGIEMERSGTKTLTIALEEKGEVARWCSGEIYDTSDCYSIDETGYIFSKVSLEASSTPSVIYRMTINDDVLGRQFLDEEDFKNLSFFIGQLEGLSLDPREVAITDINYMTVHLGEGGKLIVNRADELSKVLGNIAAIISDKSVAPSFPQFLRELDYIKLDSGNKVVYKIKARPETSSPVE